MGDHLRAGMPPCCVTKPTSSTRPCIPLGLLSRVPALIGCGKGGNVTSAGWQVTLCDPMWHVSFRSGAVLVAQTATVLLYGGWLAWLSGTRWRTCGSLSVSTCTTCRRSSTPTTVHSTSPTSPSRSPANDTTSSAPSPTSAASTTSQYWQTRVTNENRVVWFYTHFKCLIVYRVIILYFSVPVLLPIVGILLYIVYMNYMDFTGM